MNKVNIDYTMAEKAVDWLELIKSGADDEAIRGYFMEHVAPTKGCQSIIHHWERFTEWDNDKFYDFILGGLGRINSDRPLVNDDGSLTNLGIRRMLWTAAYDNPERLRRDLEELKQRNIADSAAALARNFLPENAELKADFYVVLFGGSSAYSVGDENGFDLLQMPLNPDSTLDIDDALRTFAHELHHTGFAFCNESKLNKDIQLLAILAAEGCPTYFIDGFPHRADIYSQTGSKVQQDIAAEWHGYQERLPELYSDAEKDIIQCIDGEADRDALFGKWMGGLKGPAYVLGADMYSVIDKHMGTDSAKVVAGDFRKFLTMYNKAAKTANNNGETLFVFDQTLADKISKY
jgi:hypothetical protein